MKNNFVLSLLMLFVFIQLFMLPERSLGDHSELTKGKKVLVVASYHKGYKWVDDIMSTLEHELSGAEITFFYMDTKRNIDQAEAKAKEAYALYKKIQPDAVITIDDNAQTYFVVPYLKDKVATPVFFCGVNDNASKYGFPASNVTGVLEKKHYRESISFAQIIAPKVQKVAILYRPTPSNKVNVGQIEKEKERYTAEIVSAIPVNTLGEVQSKLKEIAQSVDALILLNMTGITDEKNNKLEGHDVIAHVADTTKLITIGASDWEIEAGTLCGVIKTGEEQGLMVAQQLFALWEGKKLKNLPVQQNVSGQRYVNLATMKKLNLQLRPALVIGTKIIAGN